MSVKILTGDCRSVLTTLPDESIHMVCTSPPYFGLRAYLPDGHPDKGKEIGLEASPEAYIAEMVAVFASVRRVLRSDGTLWLNLGDSYASNFRGNRPGNWSTSTLSNPGRQDRIPRSGPKWENHNVPTWRRSGQSIKNMMMIPARVALAMQADGWILRSDIIYAKPNPMPESVADRPTNAYEHVFLFAKSRRYFYDAEAVREPDSGQDHLRNILDRPEPSGGLMPQHRGIRSADGRNGSGRNLRNVWTIATAPFKEAHFATFPPRLAEICIKAGTSEKGCCRSCGAPWVREIEKAYRQSDNHGPKSRSMSRRHKTLGWSASCKCNGNRIPLPCTILDPFAGAGTVGLVANRLQQDAILIEPNPEYAEMAKQRITGDAPLLAAKEA